MSQVHPELIPAWHAKLAERRVARIRDHHCVLGSAIDSSGKMDETKTIPTAYEQWGGLPATLAALEGFDTVRATDAWLRGVFAKLDQLNQVQRTPDALVSLMSACNFEPEDMSRINSPLLDGLWKAATGLDPDGTTSFDALPLICLLYTSDAADE